MKKLFFPDKSYSWLQLPASLKGYPTTLHPHLTIKYFGGADIDSYAIEERLKIVPATPASEFTWEPKFWSSFHDHKNYYVLAFTKYPAALDSLHKMFDLVRDQYIPWTPHITVTKEFFLLVEDQGFTPEDCKLEFGEIELCLGSPAL